ncbi:helix-turn-helix domain-containing protein [Streptomyces aculeolatus]
MEQHTAETFAVWLRDQLTRRDYDLGLRGGGQTKFAADSGISRATISRMLSGQGATDTRVLALLAEALHLPLSDILVRAGILTADELGAVQHPSPGTRRITPDEAADELGITDEQSRDLFRSMTETLQRKQRNRKGGRRAAD